MCPFPYNEYANSTNDVITQNVPSINNILIHFSYFILLPPIFNIIIIHKVVSYLMDYNNLLFIFTLFSLL